jgi:ribosomal-protein-alanine N-acetyltransferase
MKFNLNTNRVFLREFTEADVNDLYRLDSDPDVMRYISDGTTKTYETVRTGIKSMIAYYDKHPGLGVWHSSNAEGNFIGWCALKYLGETQDIEVGYRLLKEYWGNGYATEGARALLHYGFDTLGLDRIVAVANPANARSRRVIEKIGLQFKEYTVRYNSDVAYYAITRQEYHQLNARREPAYITQ